MNRRALLSQLLEQRRPLGDLFQDLQQAGPPPNEDLVALTHSHLSKALDRVRAGEQTFEDLVAWAKEVELTDDVGREPGHAVVVNQILFEMASPEIDDRNAAARVTAWRELLSTEDVVGTIHGDNFVILPDRTDWFSQYTKRIDEGVMKPEQPGVHYPCPCCGYPTLTERGGYDICYLCDWEDDGQDDPRADEAWGGPNGGYSLTQARSNFAANGIMYSPDEERTRDTEAAREAKRAVCDAFDAIRSAGPEAAEELLTGLEEAKERLKAERRRST